MSMTITPGVTYWYRSKLATAVAEWGEVDRDLRHARNCFRSLLELIGRENLERALDTPGKGSLCDVYDVDEALYTTIRALCDSALVSYERAFDFDTNGRRAHLDRALVAGDPELADTHEALRTARNKLVVHPSSGLENSDCEVELKRDGALRIDLRTRNALTPVDAGVLLKSDVHITTILERYLRPEIDRATWDVEVELTSRAHIIAGSTNTVGFQGDAEHRLVRAHQDHRMVDPFANPKRRNAASRAYPPASGGADPARGSQRTPRATP